ncbi:MAG TPA: metal-dependent hydrolase, partial [Pirellulales bacterium]
MAGFKTHITTSSILGLGYGGVAYGVYHLPPSTCILAAGICGVSGMLPDIDSGPGRPLRESMAFAAAVVPMMMVDRFKLMGMDLESIVMVGGLLYLL